MAAFGKIFETCTIRSPLIGAAPDKRNLTWLKTQPLLAGCWVKIKERESSKNYNPTLQRRTIWGGTRL